VSAVNSILLLAAAIAVNRQSILTHTTIKMHRVGSLIGAETTCWFTFRGL